jgi:hypothetical protein
LILQSEAFLLLNKWKADSSPLDVIVELKGVFFRGACVLHDFNEIGFSLTVSGATLTGCEFDWGKCCFEYGEPRSSKDATAGNCSYTSVLIAMRPSKERFTFMEISSV